MADQGKWFKLWCSSLRDDDLENLSLEDWARWARLATHVKANGDNGTISVSDPARALQFVLRLHSFEDIVRFLFRIPGIVLATAPITWPHGRDREPVSFEGQIVRGRNFQSVGVATPLSVRVGTPHEEGVGMVLTKRCVSISFINWVKYQADNSTQRVKRLRVKNGVSVTANVTAQEEKRREEKRREENTPKVPMGTSSKVLEWFEITWRNYPKERRVGKKACFKTYQRAVKTLEEAKAIARALENYLSSKTVKEGFIKNATTFFNNWEDYKHDEQRSGQSILQPETNPIATRRSPQSGGLVAAKQVLDRVGDD